MSTIVWGARHPNPNPEAKKVVWSAEEQIWMVSWIRRFANNLPGGDYLTSEQNMSNLAKASLYSDTDAHGTFHPKHVGETSWKDGFNHKAKRIDRKWGYQHQARILQLRERHQLLDRRMNPEEMRKVLVDTYVANVPWEADEDHWLTQWTAEHSTWRLEENYGKKCFYDLITAAVDEDERHQDRLLSIFHPHHVNESAIAERIGFLSTSCVRAPTLSEG
jgi:hypothetical protein